MEKYEFKKKIGHGSFGDVYLVAQRKTQTLFAMKEIQTLALNKKEQTDVFREVDILSKISHPNIIRYIESFHHHPTARFYIIMEHCEGGDLYNKINKQRGKLFPEHVILQCFVQICRAVQYIHERRILHRDIKTQNIFISHSKQGRWIVKLGDFGISKIIEGTTELARTCIGTPYYLSPEVWENKPYNNKSDLWALGCVLYEMSTLKHAFESGCMKTLMLKILRGSYPPISNRYSYDLRNMVAALLRKNPRDRPSINSILYKRFIKKAEENLYLIFHDINNGNNSVTKNATKVYVKHKRRRYSHSSSGYSSRRQSSASISKPYDNRCTSTPSDPSYTTLKVVAYKDQNGAVLLSPVKRNETDRFSFIRILSDGKAMKKCGKLYDEILKSKSVANRSLDHSYMKTLDVIRRSNLSERRRWVQKRKLDKIDSKKDIKRTEKNESKSTIGNQAKSQKKQERQNSTNKVRAEIQRIALQQHMKKQKEISNEEFVKETGNSCVMWIDLSTGRKESDESPSKRSEALCVQGNTLIKSEDPNTTYVIHKESSFKCSSEINDESTKKTIIVESVLQPDTISHKSSCDIEEDVKNDQSIPSDNPIGDNKNNLTLTSTNRRKSSSSFIETLRKLVCLHESNVSTFETTKSTLQNGMEEEQIVMGTTPSKDNSNAERKSCTITSNIMESQNNVIEENSENAMLDDDKHLICENSSPSVLNELAEAIIADNFKALKDDKQKIESFNDSQDFLNSASSPTKTIDEPLNNEKESATIDSAIENEPLKDGIESIQPLCTSFSSELKKISRHNSLPNISTDAKNDVPTENLKELLDRKINDSEFSSYEICEERTDDSVARAKCLHSDLSDKSKSSTESSSGSPSNEDIWHLAGGGSETILKHPVKPDLDLSNHLTESDSCSNDLEKGSSSNSNFGMFSFWEAQRAYLESRIGIEALLKVYRLVADLEQRSVDEKLDCSDFQKILGRGNEDLIDNIIQLVVADNFFNVDQR